MILNCAENIIAAKKIAGKIPAILIERFMIRAIFAKPSKGGTFFIAIVFLTFNFY